jgi:selenocysteine lyase/cysteine desulfurase
MYLNHAGTSWPKPPEVIEAAANALTLPPHKLNEAWQQDIRTVADFFQISNPDHLLLTSSATAALALAINELPWQAGDHLISSHMEHHALSRWLTKLSLERGVDVTLIPRTDRTVFDLDYYEEALQARQTRLVAVSHASNVTGELLPVEEIVSLARRYGAMVLLDAAQTAGILPVDVESLGLDMMVFAGHKGPRGPQGIGGLYAAASVEMFVPGAACEAGKGMPADSRRCVPRLSWCDSGSVNMAGLAGLAAGLKDAAGESMAVRRRRQLELTQYLLDGIAGVSGLRVLGAGQAAARTAAAALVPRVGTPGDLAAFLQERNIWCSAGFQCAPLAHEALGTGINGVLRISSGPETSKAEIDELLSTLQEYCFINK